MRGVLSLCVLRVVADGPTYGYAIAGWPALVLVPVVALALMFVGGMLTRS
jgi:hypothetical protein